MGAGTVTKPVWTDFQKELNVAFKEFKLPEPLLEPMFPVKLSFDSGIVLSVLFRLIRHSHDFSFEEILKITKIEKEFNPQ